MFENWTERARAAFEMGRQEAVRGRHPYVDSRHLLFGICKEGSGTAMQALKNLGVDLSLLFHRVLGTMPPDKGPEVTPRVVNTIDHVGKRAAEIALAFGHRRVGTEHLLLALLRKGDEFMMANQVLCGLGLTYKKVAVEVRGLMGTPGKGVAWGATASGGFAYTNMAEGLKGEEAQKSSTNAVPQASADVTHTVLLMAVQSLQKQLAEVVEKQRVTNEALQGLLAQKSAPERPTLATLLAGLGEEGRKLRTLMDTLKDPNPTMSWLALLALADYELLTTGTAFFWLLPSFQDEAYEVRLLETTKVTPFPADGDYPEGGYYYQQGDLRAPLPAQQVLRVKRADPRDPKPLSWLNEAGTGARPPSPVEEAIMIMDRAVAEISKIPGLRVIQYGISRDPHNKDVRLRVSWLAPDEKDPDKEQGEGPKKKSLLVRVPNELLKYSASPFPVGGFAHATPQSAAAVGGEAGVLCMPSQEEVEKLREVLGKAPEGVKAVAVDLPDKPEDDGGHYAGAEDEGTTVELAQKQAGTESCPRRHHTLSDPCRSIYCLCPCAFCDGQRKVHG